MRSWERIESFVGAVSQGGVVSPDLALNDQRLRDDQATIACGSGDDRASIVVLRERTPYVRSLHGWLDSHNCKTKLRQDRDLLYHVIACVARLMES